MPFFNLLSQTTRPTRGLRRTALVAFGAAIALMLPVLATAGEAVYSPMSVEAAHQAAMDWAAQQPEFRPEARELIDPLWNLPEETSTPAQRFDAALRTFYLVDPGARKLVDACVLQPGGPPQSIAFPARPTGEAQPFFENNLRAFYARYLTVSQMYDEALAVFADIDPAHLVDPAAMLFYKATCEHILLRREEGLATIRTLQENTIPVPTRYATLAAMMKQDLEVVRPKSLDEVARQMRDVERRLALGHAGERVQQVEDRIVATLDELIEKMEEQQNGGGGGGGGGGNSQGSPSRGGQSGAGQAPGRRPLDEINRRPKGLEEGWGKLPEKQQAEVKNMLDTQFPSHYRQAVAEYLRKLAQRPAPASR